MPTQAEKAERFLALHHEPQPFMMPNPWDPGSARILASLGFPAVATTSSGFAASLGRFDGNVSLDEALAHSAAMAAAVDVPVSADFENGFADAPDDVAANIDAAIATGLSGGSIENWSGEAVYDPGLARERVAAAAERAHAGPVHFVLTARADNLLRGETDHAVVIDALQSFQEAGADVLFAPGLVELDDIRRVVEAVDLPVNVLISPRTPPVAELAEV